MPSFISTEINDNSIWVHDPRTKLTFGFAILDDGHGGFVLADMTEVRDREPLSVDITAEAIEAKETAIELVKKMRAKKQE